MKIIHTADLHIDSNMESNLTKEQAARRRSELLASFEKIVLFGEEKGVNLILISGDMFDKTTVRKTALRTVFDIIVAHPGIDFLYLRGNHDCNNFEEELAERLPANLKTFSKELWTSYHYGEVVITGREISDENAAALYSDLVLDVSKCNIVMLHGQEASYDGADKTHIINLKSLQNRYIDYLALGHVHKYKQEKLDERGTYCYPGCPEPRGFDECGEKGFVLLDIEDKKVTGTFVSLQQRQFHEVNLNISPDMDMAGILKKTEEVLSGIPSTDLVKLVVTGFTEIDRALDTDRLFAEFDPRFYFLKIYNRTRAKIDYDSFAYDRSLKGSFVRLMQKTEMDEAKKAEIIETGIRAIMGEEILF